MTRREGARSREAARRARRIVVKVGSSILTDAGVLRGRVFTQLARQVSALMDEGREVVGWPETVLSRGRVIVHDGKLLAKPGEGRFLARTAGDAAKGTGRMAPEFDPARNFGAKLM